MKTIATKMLKEMKRFSKDERTACFRTVIAFVTKHDKIWTEGIVKGTILDHKMVIKGLATILFFITHL